MTRPDAAYWLDGERLPLAEWLAGWARLLEEAAVAVSGLRDAPVDITLPVVAKMQAEAAALGDAARRLELGEHRQ